MKFTKGVRGKNFAGDFEAGLDDIDDDGKVKNKKSDKKQLTAADGGLEFRNLGSTA